MIQVVAASGKWREKAYADDNVFISVGRKARV